jgi:hypothetical protein
MIDQPTVLILGAGASTAVGYPTGHELTDRIYIKLSTLNNTHIASPLYKAAAAAGFETDHIIAFGKLLLESQALSVDDFLLNNHDFRGIGKFCIAHELIAIEHEDGLKLQGRGSWYRSLRLALGGSLDALRKSELKIITFNYDHSLQHFLYTAFRALGGNASEPGEVKTLIDKLEFLPMHGRLSPLSWQHPKGRSYGPIEDPIHIRECARSILISDEAVGINYSPSAPWDLIEKAKQVLFLGFGFHASNMAKLRLEKFEGSKSIAFGGSVMGLPPLQLADLKRRFGFHAFESIDVIFEKHILSTPIQPGFGAQLISVG